MTIEEQAALLAPALPWTDKRDNWSRAVLGHYALQCWQNLDDEWIAEVNTVSSVDPVSSSLYRTTIGTDYTLSEVKEESCRLLLAHLQSTAQIIDRYLGDRS